MGVNFKWSHYCSVPVDRSELQGITDAFEKAVSADNPNQTVTITVNGAKSTSVVLTSEKLAEFIEIMKLTLSEH